MQSMILKVLLNTALISVGAAAMDVAEIEQLKQAINNRDYQVVQTFCTHFSQRSRDDRKSFVEQTLPDLINTSYNKYADDDRVIKQGIFRKIVGVQLFSIVSMLASFGVSFAFPEDSLEEKICMKSMYVEAGCGGVLTGVYLLKTTLCPVKTPSCRIYSALSDLQFQTPQPTESTRLINTHDV